MKLYNTYSQKLEAVNLSKAIGIYVCGITPYDITHIGHAFTFTVYDTLVRYLKFIGAKVTYVQNITNIDDDILMKAKQLKINWKKLAESETKKYLSDMKALNIQQPDYFPKATDNISQMIKIIETLVKKKFAYTKNGSVYFEIAKYKKFGQLSRLDYCGQLEVANERGNYPEDPNKKNPLDFVLWQAKKNTEPYWESPWGKGRPGWHIECSAMSNKYLGKNIAIHGGGEDLIFPHHEAEIAQNKSWLGQRTVKIWMHTKSVYCGEKKMSKSLGNMVFISKLLKKYSPTAIRLYLLSNSWQKAWNFEEKKLKKFETLDNKITTITKNSSYTLSASKLKELTPAFISALESDLNTQKAIIELTKYLNGPSANPDVVFTASTILGLKH